jgi:hypothetical protein
MSSPCHIELILSEKEAPVKKEAEEVVAPRKKNQGLRGADWDCRCILQAGLGSRIRSFLKMNLRAAACRIWPGVAIV